MTSETFEAEFVAWNQFREEMGLPPYDRIQFAATVAHHNAAITRKSPEDREVWREMEAGAAQFDIDRQEQHDA